MSDAQSWRGISNGKLEYRKLSYQNRSFILQSINIDENKLVSSVLEVIGNETDVIYYSTSSSLREAKICAEELLERFLKPTACVHSKSGGI